MLLIWTNKIISLFLLFTLTGILYNWMISNNTFLPIKVFSYMVVGFSHFFPIVNTCFFECSYEHTYIVVWYDREIIFLGDLVGSSHICCDDSTFCEKCLQDCCRESFLKTRIDKYISLRKNLLSYIVAVFHTDEDDFIWESKIFYLFLESCPFLTISHDRSTPRYTIIYMTKSFYKYVSSFKIGQTSYKSDPYRLYLCI